MKYFCLLLRFKLYTLRRVLIIILIPPLKSANQHPLIFLCTIILFHNVINFAIYNYLDVQNQG